MSENDWTEDRIALLRQWHADGLSYGEIAAAINGRTGSAFTRNACIGKATRIGIVAGSPRRKTVPRTSKPPQPKRKHRLYLPDGSLPHDTELLKEIETAPQPTGFLGISFLALEPQHCRYPRGGNNGEAFLFCGQPKTDASSYCASCHAQCYGGRTLKISDGERQRRSAWAARISAVHRTGRTA